LVGEEFVVDEIEAEGIAAEDDGGLGGRNGGGWWGCDVGFFAEERFDVACWGAVGVDGAFEAVWTRHFYSGLWFVLGLEFLYEDTKMNGGIESLLSGIFSSFNISFCPSLGMMSGSVLAARSGIVKEPTNSYATLATPAPAPRPL
jgi:hypothetical protein